MKSIAELLDHETCVWKAGDSDDGVGLMQYMIGQPVTSVWSEDDTAAYSLWKMKNSWHILVRQVELPKNWLLIPEL